MSQCGKCNIADKIEAGVYPSSEGAAYWRALCDCAKYAAPVDAPVTQLTELRREGKRIVKVGQWVSCQPRNMKGTAKSEGEVVRIEQVGDAPPIVIVGLRKGGTARIRPDFIHVPNNAPVRDAA